MLKGLFSGNVFYIFEVFVKLLKLWKDQICHVVVNTLVISAVFPKIIDINFWLVPKRVA